MIVDINMHWLPENLFKDKSLLSAFMNIVPRAYGERVMVTAIPETGKQQIVIEKPSGYENLNFGEEHLFDAESRLEAMNEASVDKAVLRIPCWQEWLNLEMAKKLNDLLAKDISEHPDRLMGLAMAPPWGDKESFYELERCVKDLGFVGVEVAAHYGDLHLDTKELRPHFKKLNELGVPVCVHHTPLPVSYNDIIDNPNLRRLYGRCIAQMISLTRILYSDLLEECPNVRLVYTMLAGGFFAYADFLAPQKSGFREEMERFNIVGEKVRGYLDRNIYFSTHIKGWGKAQLECAVKVLGAEHILFGSSYPVRREWMLTGKDYLSSLDISENEKALILGENAVKIFKIRK